MCIANVIKGYLFTYNITLLYIGATHYRLYAVLTEVCTYLLVYGVLVHFSVPFIRD